MDADYQAETFRHTVMLRASTMDLAQVVAWLRYAYHALPFRGKWAKSGMFPLIVLFGIFAFAGLMGYADGLSSHSDHASLQAYESMVQMMLPLGLVGVKWIRIARTTAEPVPSQISFIVTHLADDLVPTWHGKSAFRPPRVAA
jgi:hypothetical protein